MKKKFVVITIILLTFIVMMACDLGILDTSGTEEPYSNPYEQPYYQTQIAQETNDGSGSADTPKSEWQPSIPQDSGDQNPETANAGTHEYSVEATNFDCTCQVDGNITPIIKFTGNQVEFPNADGSGFVYDKIGDNTYKRTYMGYYILQNGSGAQVTSTVVDEEQHTVLIFSSSGYIMENYQGSSETPCCYYTNTIVK
jgi:hypothetical protein